MGWSGTLSAWAWRKHTKILKQKQEKQHKTMHRNQTNFEYLEELKRKLDKTVSNDYKTGGAYKAILNMFAEQLDDEKFAEHCKKFFKGGEDEKTNT